MPAAGPQLGRQSRSADGHASGAGAIGQPDVSPGRIPPQNRTPRPPVASMRPTREITPSDAIDTLAYILWHDCRFPAALSRLTVVPECRPAGTPHWYGRSVSHDARAVLSPPGDHAVDIYRIHCLIFTGCIV